MLLRGVYMALDLHMAMVSLIMKLQIQESGTDKPVVAFIAGLIAPLGRRMGHAGGFQLWYQVGREHLKIKSRSSEKLELRWESPATIGVAMLDLFKQRGLLN
ncbi:hypothetical protein Dimus_023468 [Dionaea muscipula]